MIVTRRIVGYLSIIFLAILLLSSTAAAQESVSKLSWKLDGQLADSEEVVRAFLRPLIKTRQRWSEDDQEAVREFLLKDMGYQSRIFNEHQQDGSTLTTIHLEPATLVRHIVVEMDAYSIPKRFRQPIFTDELARKMTLRPGSPLAEDDAARKMQLDAEAKRLTSYLINDGFYEANVTIEVTSPRPFEAKVTVVVTPGPPYFIGTIDIIGNNAVRKESITPIFHHKRLCLLPKICFGQRRFSRKQLLKDVQKLIGRYQKTEGFPGVHIRTDYDPRHSFDRSSHEVNLQIDIRERRKIDVNIEGNHAFTDAQLEKQLTIYDQASYDDVEVIASAESIQNFYQSKGFFEAQVNWERERFTEFNFERILFFVDEGPRLRVRKLQFSGNKFLSSKSLRKELGTQVYKRLIVGGRGGFTTPGLLDQDVDRIISLYKKAGYREAQVALEVGRVENSDGSGPALAAVIAGRMPTKGLTITFHITEGPQTTIGGIVFTFSGAHSLKQKQLLRQVRLQKGDAFLEDVALEDGKKIGRFYFTSGYPRSVIATEFENNDDTVIIKYIVQENTQARIGKVAIRGNFKTKDWVVLQELQLTEGDLLTQAVAERAQANLRRSGLFSSVQVDYVGRQNPRQETVNVLVRVEERFDYSARYEGGAGYSTENQGFLKGAGGFHNLGGIGANLDLDVTYGQRVRSGELKLALPRWVMKRHIGAGLRLDASINGKEEEEKRFGLLKTLGGSVALSRQGRYGFFKGWNLSLRYDYRRRNRDVTLVRPSGNSDDIQQTKVTTISSALGPQLVIDRRTDRDGNANPLSPGGGYRLEFRAQYADEFLGTDRFLKLRFSGQQFWTVNDRLMLSTGLRYDHGVPLGGIALLPEIERFFAGGDTTVRGYEEDHLAIELVDSALGGIESITQFRVVPAGGNIRLVQNIDLQIEVWELAGWPFASAFFVDTGLITNSLIDLQLTDFAVGVGAALARWVTPFGSLSIEYAVPMTLKLGDNPRGRWHVNFGVLF